MPHSHMYSVSMDTFFNKVAGTDTQILGLDTSITDELIVRVHAIYLALHSSAHLKEAGERLFRLVLNRDAAGATGITARPLNPNSPAAATVGRTQATAPMTGEILFSWFFNSRLPFRMVFEPEQRPVVVSGGDIVLTIPNIPSGNHLMAGTILFEEISP